MLFSTEEAKKTMKVSRINTPGIKEGLEMTDIEVGRTQSGNLYVDFHFDSPQGVTRKRIWEPNLNPEVGSEAENQAKAKENVNEALQHWVHILETYLPSDQAVLKGNSFEEICNLGKSKLMTVIPGVKLRGKLLYDSKGQYVQFPRFIPYLEKEEVENTTLSISNWEQENRMSRAEAPQSGSALNPASGGTNDTVPF